MGERRLKAPGLLNAGKPPLARPERIPQVADTALTGEANQFPATGAVLNVGDRPYRAQFFVTLRQSRPDVQGVTVQIRIRAAELIAARPTVLITPQAKQPLGQPPEFMMSAMKFPHLFRCRHLSCVGHCEIQLGDNRISPPMPAAMYEAFNERL